MRRQTWRRRPRNVVFAPRLNRAVRLTRFNRSKSKLACSRDGDAYQCAEIRAAQNGALRRDGGIGRPRGGLQLRRRAFRRWLLHRSRAAGAGQQPDGGGQPALSGRCRCHEHRQRLPRHAGLWQRRPGGIGLPGAEPGLLPDGREQLSAGRRRHLGRRADQPAAASAAAELRHRTAVAGFRRADLVLGARHPRRTALDAR